MQSLAVVLMFVAHAELKLCLGCLQLIAEDQRFSEFGGKFLTKDCDALANEVLAGNDEAK